MYVVINDSKILLLSIKNRVTTHSPDTDNSLTIRGTPTHV